MDFAQVAKINIARHLENQKQDEEEKQREREEQREKLEQRLNELKAAKADTKEVVAALAELSVDISQQESSTMATPIKTDFRQRLSGMFGGRLSWLAPPKPQVTQTPIHVLIL